LRKQLKHKDLSQLEIVKLKKIIRDPTEIMDLSIKLQDVTVELKNIRDSFLPESIIYTISNSSIILIIVIIVHIINKTKELREESNKSCAEKKRDFHRKRQISVFFFKEEGCYDPNKS